MNKNYDKDFMDDLVGNAIPAASNELQFIVKAMHEQSICLHKPVRQPLPGEDINDVDTFGDCLSRAINVLERFLTKYNNQKTIN